MLPAFITLKQDDQVSLLENGWSELFLLTACETQLTVDWHAVSKAFVTHGEVPTFSLRYVDVKMC